ncbi:MAG: alpha/beta hydrolase [Acholeplasmatales bacterium]|nr:alpha/beta hydrolase [Acholeplasmatales bacterium]
MSFTSKLVYLYFKHQKRYNSEYWDEKIKNTNTPQIPPLPKREYRFENNIFYFNENSTSDIAIYYIHGGAYLNTFSKYHFKFIDKLIKKTNALVIAPNYDLIPFSNGEKLIDYLSNIYLDCVSKNSNKKIIIIGDSAGGGLSLSLALFLSMNNYKKPDKMVLLSPCVDITISNPKIEEFKKYDPWLYTERLSICCKYFADNLDYKDYRVSPLYGDIDLLKNMLIFVGTKEILNPDITLFYEKLKDKETNKLIIGKNMLHVYPILPIKEAKKALKIISDYILD